MRLIGVGKATMRSCGARHPAMSAVMRASRGKSSSTSVRNVQPAGTGSPIDDPASRAAESSASVCACAGSHGVDTWSLPLTI
jgi:hypothetical protein